MDPDVARQLREMRELVELFASRTEAMTRLVVSLARVHPERERLLSEWDAAEFDNVIRYAKYLALLGDWAYTSALVLNRWFNAARRRLGLPYWSLSAWLKRQVKEAVKAIDRFESALAAEARRREEARLSARIWLSSRG